MSDVKIKPVGDRVLVEFCDGEEELGGILLPENAREKPQEATVVAVSDSVDSDIINIGDIVLTSKFAGTEIKDGNKTYSIYKTDNILAILG